MNFMNISLFFYCLFISEPRDERRDNFLLFLVNGSLGNQMLFHHRYRIKYEDRLNDDRTDNCKPKVSSIS